MFLYIAIAIVNLCSEFSFFYMYYALQAKRFHIAKMMLLIVVPTIIILFISPLPKFLLAHFGISTLLTAHVINLALNLLFLIAVGERDIKNRILHLVFLHAVVHLLPWICRIPGLLHKQMEPFCIFFIPSEHPVQLFAGLGDEQGDSQIRSLQDHSLSAEPN